MFTHEEWNALLLSLLAGLSTVLGAFLAVLRRPGPALLAFLLGVAIGVMGLLSIAELWIWNAIDNGPLWVTVFVAAGAALFYVVHPYFPDFQTHPPQQHHDSDTQELKSVAARVARDTTLGSPTASSTAGSHRQGAPSRRPFNKAIAQIQSQKDDLDSRGSQELSASSQASEGSKHSEAASDALSDRSSSSARSAELLRVGLLMALTMTLHNAPEGFAVLFASFSDLGLRMALAIAVHNIPEGVIVAAPVYAATGNRWKACGLAFASGLSEPVGALIALVIVRPFLSQTLVHLMLAFVGGIMLAVCCTELWTEGRKCMHDRHLFYGIGLGASFWAVVMAITHIVGV